MEAVERVERVEGVGVERVAELDGGTKASKRATQNEERQPRRRRWRRSGDGPGADEEEYEECDVEQGE